MSGQPLIAVLGGSGFIGTRFVARLKELGLLARIGDLKASEAYPDIQVPCDVRDASSMRKLLTGTDAIVNLAAEHRDDVRPISRYKETNVEGAIQVCRAAREAGVQTIIFTSSVAVYGFQPFPVNENGPYEPFNPYGETKLLAEKVYQAWASESPGRSLVIIRPTVVFGEGNRGNVYNLLNQIATGRFLMVGSGTNRKSMAYVGNVADVLTYSLRLGPGTHIFNYTDGPDLDMNGLVSLVNKALGTPPRIRGRIPYSIALAGGYVLDLCAKLSNRTFPVSAIRIKKFCETTEFSSERILQTGFRPRFTLEAAIGRTILHEFGSEGANLEVTPT